MSPLLLSLPGVSGGRKYQARPPARQMNGVTAAPRLLRRGVRSFASNGKPAYVAMPETPMITNNGTHVFERKGWEYSTYMGILGGPILLYLGLSNAPETDSEVFARAEAYAKRKGTNPATITKRVSGPVSSQYTYERGDVGERPTLA